MNAMIKRYLRYVDRRLAATVVLLVLVVIGINRTWASSIDSKLATKQDAVEQTTKDLAAARTRLTELRSDGISDVSGLLERVSSLESLLPNKVDDLAITRLIVAVAESSGVTLEQIKLREDASGGDVIGELKGFRFEFAVTGSYAATANFLTTLVTSRQFVATFDRLEITSIAAGDQANIYTGEVAAKGQLILWTLREEPISDAKPIEAPISPVTTNAPTPAITPSPDGSTPTAPVDPTAPTTVPQGTPPITPAPTTTTP
jgi:Tfp pilus assembly protein PilO